MDANELKHSGIRGLSEPEDRPKRTEEGWEARGWKARKLGRGTRDRQAEDGGEG